MIGGRERGRGNVYRAPLSPKSLDEFMSCILFFEQSQTTTRGKIYIYILISTRKCNADLFSVSKKKKDIYILSLNMFFLFSFSF